MIVQTKNMGGVFGSLRLFRGTEEHSDRFCPPMWVYDTPTALSEAGIASSIFMFS